VPAVVPVVAQFPTRGQLTPIGERAARTSEPTSPVDAGYRRIHASVLGFYCRSLIAELAGVGTPLIDPADTRVEQRPAGDERGELFAGAGSERPVGGVDNAFLDLADRGPVEVVDGEVGNS
jgi:hypothetical protein